MLNAKAVALLKIRQDEVRMVILVAALFLFVQAGQGIGENAAFALFLARVEVARLPYMYMGLGVVVFLASLAYSASLSRFHNSAVVVNLMAGAAILFVIERAALALLGVPVYPVLWLTTFGMSVIVGTLLWTVAGEVCDARQAKRLFPLFTSMGILGSVLGNLFTGIAARIAGTANLIVLYASLLAAGFILTRVITRSYFRPEVMRPRAKFSLIDDMRAGYEFVRTSKLFSLIAWSSILYSVLFFTVDFPFSQIVSIQYSGDAAGLAGFKGLFTSITTAVTFLISLFIANRLYTKLGIVNSLLIMPVTYVTGFVIFFVSFTFTGAIIARFSQLIVLGGIMSTAWNALFNVAPPERRGQILAFNNGVPAQIGVVVSGLLIVLSNTVLADTKVVLILGSSVAFLALYLTMRMRPAYGDALLSALRAGRTEVFSDEDEAFSGYKDDPAALQVILKALHEPKAVTRRLAAEMLAKLGNPHVIPDLVTLLSDPDASVRTAATGALADLDARQVLHELIRGLDDPDDSVREQTLASLLRLGVDPSPALIGKLEHLLEETNSSIRVGAAEVLLRIGDHQKAEALLYDLLRDTDPNQRRVAFEAVGHILSNHRERLSIDPDLFLRALHDPSPIIRREAVRLITEVKPDRFTDLLVPCLEDSDAQVRAIASESLKQAWSLSRSAVLRALEESQGIQVNSLLDSIPPGEEEALGLLRKFIQREVTNIQYSRSIVAALPQGGRAIRLLCDTMKSREALSEERVIKAVGLFGNPRAMELVRRGLNAGNPGTRAAALEALETLGDKKITAEVLPILDRGGVFQADKNQAPGASAVIKTLLSDQDYWLRALATRSIADLYLTEFTPELHGKKSDPSSLVRQAAMDALELLESDKTMKTLNTISTLERILLLREVPMFSRLGPEDLAQIAEIAHEQLYSAGTVICQDGEPGNTLFLIVDGSVDVIKEKDHRETVIAVRDAGEFVGEMAILESAPRSATLRAHTPVRVLVIEGSAFKTILLDRPEVAVSVLRHMSTRVRELNDRVGAASRTSPAGA